MDRYTGMDERAPRSTTGRRSLAVVMVLVALTAAGGALLGAHLPATRSAAAADSSGTSATVPARPPVTHTIPAVPNAPKSTTTAAPETTTTESTAPATTAAAPVPAPAAPPAPASSNDLCSLDQAVGFAHFLLDPYGIPVPGFSMLPAGTPSYYQTGAGIVHLGTCSSLSPAAHEISHFVMDRANGMNFTQHVADALNFASGTWIQGSEMYPGIEYAAHCIGNQLWGYGPYTKCPDGTLAAYARTVIQRAA